MGFKLSRLAQAIMAAVLCSTAAIAADKADDFYIEIKSLTAVCSSNRLHHQPENG